jgi:hypothetical protein
MTSQPSHTLGKLEAEHQTIDELEDAPANADLEFQMEATYVASTTALEGAFATITGIEGDQVGGGPTGGVHVNAAPTGPAVPTGGWSVAFADAFNAPFGSGGGQDGFWYPNKTPAHNGGNPAIDDYADSTNSTAVFNSSQVSQRSDGLHLTTAYSAGRAPASGSYPIANYVAGTVRSYPAGAPNGTGFAFKLGGGVTWCFEMVATSPLNTGETDAAWWGYSDQPGGGSDELDFTEYWGWNNPDVTAVGAGANYSSCPAYITPVTQEQYAHLTAAYDQVSHRWTTVVFPDLTSETYIDDLLVTHTNTAWNLGYNTVSASGILAAPSSGPTTYMGLILSYLTRTPVISSGFTSGSRDWVIRSVAAYQDTPHAGTNMSGGGIAPGTGDLLLS